MRVRGGLRLGHQGRAFLVGGKHGVDQRHLVARHLLCDPADARPARDFNRPALEAKLAADDAEQRGFAGAITADNTNLVAGGDSDRRVLDQSAAFDGICDIVDFKHGASIACVCVPASIAAFAIMAFQTRILMVIGAQSTGAAAIVAPVPVINAIQ